MGKNRNRKSDYRWKPILVSAFLLADGLGAYVAQQRLAAPALVRAQDEVLASSAGDAGPANTFAHTSGDQAELADARLAQAEPVQVAAYQSATTIVPMPAIRFDAGERTGSTDASAPAEPVTPALAVEHSGPDPVLLKLAHNDSKASLRLAKRLNFKVVRDPSGTRAIGFTKAFADGPGNIELPGASFADTDAAAPQFDVGQLGATAPVVAEAPVIEAPLTQAQASTELPALATPDSADGVSQGAALPTG